MVEENDKKSKKTLNKCRAEKNTVNSGFFFLSCLREQGFGRYAVRRCSAVNDVRT